MVPSFDEIKFVLLYFKADKFVSIYPTEKLYDWSEEAYEKMINVNGEKVTLEAAYDEVIFKVKSYLFLLQHFMTNRHRTNNLKCICQIQ